MPEKSKLKESLTVAGVAAGIILVVLLFLWIPFKLIPAIFSKGSNLVATSLTSTFIPGENSATSSASNNSQNQNAVTNVSSNSNSANTARTQTTYVQRSYYGLPDLQVSIVATGIIDPATRQFIATSYAGSGDTVAIRFAVKNIGTNSSGLWTVRLNMPSLTTPYYDSGYQRSINPGDTILYTASFDRPATQGVNLAYITVDPLNSIPENNEANNSLTVPLKIQGIAYSYSTNYNYGNSTSNNGVGTTYTWTNINANCYVNPTTAYVGNPVTWYVSATGGNGYYSYSWTGSDSLYSTDSSITKTYYSTGVKTATVTISSGGQNITKQCSIYVY